MSRHSIVYLTVGMAAVAILLLLGGVGCAKSTSAGDLTFTSSVTLGHTHNVTISGADIDNPPAEKTIDTTDTDYHFHTITLTMQDYQSLHDGGEITVTTSLVSGHTHTFTMKK